MKSIIWLPRPNIGLVKEVETISQIQFQVTGTSAEKIQGRQLEVLKTVLRNKASGQKTKIFIYNISILSFMLSLVVRLLGGKVVQCLHEPGMKNKLNYGLVKAIKIVIVEILVWLNKLIANELVVFSQQGADVLTESGYKGQYTILPLLPYATLDKQNFQTSRDFALTFVGRIHPAKNFDLFLELAAKLSAEKGLKAAIVTSSEDELTARNVQENENLKVISDNLIPDATIEAMLARSQIVFKMDKNMMQSGLVAQARYFGCFCLVNNITGFVQEDLKDNLIVASDPDDIDSIAAQVYGAVDAPALTESAFYALVAKSHESGRAQWSDFFARF